MMNFEEIAKKYPSFRAIGEGDFLSRRTYETDEVTIVRNVENLSAVKQKAEDFFGNPDIEIFSDGIIIKPEKLLKKERFCFSDFVNILYRLRASDGCPWDRAQTNMSIRRNAVEEAYELAEAVESGDADKMTEECGDVVMQGVFNAVIADSEGKFDVTDVMTVLCKKLLNRHTHIFGDKKATDPAEALVRWENAKALEKNQKSVADKLSSVPKTFGALMRANKVQKIIAKTGFEFPHISDALDKIKEEAKEFSEAGSERRESEAGDLLFSVVNVLRMSDTDPELALSGTVNRFIKRFAYIVEQAEKSGRKIEELSLNEMEFYYAEAKSKGVDE